MKIRTLKILRKNKKVEEIENNLRVVIKEKYNENTIDSSLERKINLRVKFVTKGSEWHMTIPTLIILEENKHGTTITCKSIVYRPFFLSLVFAIFCPIPALVNKDWLMYLILSCIIFAIFFGFFMNRIIYTTRDCLKELKI